MITQQTSTKTQLSNDGFTIVQSVLNTNTVEKLRVAIDKVDTGLEARQKRGSMFAIRNLLDVVPEVRNVTQERETRDLIESLLGIEAFIVRAILFDKTPETNWKVSWHQDTSIAVKECIETPGFGPWSEKAGIMHVKPPAAVLEGMLTMRIHLDDCDESNGALQVIPGSHKSGFLDDNTLQACRASDNIKLCCVQAGGAVLMKPLIAHASSPGTNPSRRRVIHLEYTANPLPGNLQWHRA